MPLSWNEIKDRALAFSKRWQGETNEDANEKPFWVEFFTVFGVDRKRVAGIEISARAKKALQWKMVQFWYTFGKQKSYKSLINI
jgi:hypothetical protein